MVHEPLTKLQCWYGGREGREGVERGKRGGRGGRGGTGARCSTMRWRSHTCCSCWCEELAQAHDYNLMVLNPYRYLQLT